MTQDAPLPADRQRIAQERFDRKLRAQLVSLITEDLIEEHRAQPLGQHSDALERVLNYFRRPPRFGLYSKNACRDFQVIALPIQLGTEPQPLDDKIYQDENEAMHAVFLHHIAELQTG